LDECTGYGIWWFGRKSIRQHQVSEPDGNGGRRYRKATTTRIRSVEERTTVPVPAYLPRELVDQARVVLAERRPPERKRLARRWELRGLMRCSCGWKMTTHTAISKGNGAAYHYYVCKRRQERRQECDCTQRSVRAVEVERAVWGLVSDLLVDPERIRSGMERLIEQERATHVGDSEREAEAWARKIAEWHRRRCAYQDQQAAGLMTLEELGARLKELESARTSAERELVALKDRRRRVEELEEDRDALLESLAGMLPEALDDLTGEERCRIYQMLRLEVMPVPQGRYEVSGALCTFAAPSG